MTYEEMWDEFVAANAPDADDYAAWAFGDEPDAAAAAAAEGRKTVMTSAYPTYAAEDEPLPLAGEYSVILNDAEEAVCIVRTEHVSIRTFDAFDEETMRREAIGDGSPSAWKKYKEAVFRGDMEACGLTFEKDSPIVIEEFVCVWPKG